MKKAILLGLIICFIGITNTNAQKENTNWDAYISDRMAQKVADGIMKAYPPNEREARILLFMNANNISSTSICSDILYNITNHKEEVANFVLAVFSSYPMITPGYFFETIGFTKSEIDMAVKAGTKKQEILRQKENEKKKQKERDIIADWNQYGKEVMSFSMYDRQNGRFHPKFEFYTRISGVLDSVIFQPEEEGGWRPTVQYGDKNIRFIVDEFGEVSDSFRKEIKQYGMDSIRVIYPADRRFEELDTVIAVPSVNYFGVEVRRNEIRAANTSYVATVKYDKKNGKWVIKECENKDGKLKDWFDESQRWTGEYERWTPKNSLGFDNYEAMLELLNKSFDDTLNDKDGKKYQIEFTFIAPGKLCYYINGCLISEYNLDFAIQMDKIEKIK